MKHTTGTTATIDPRRALINDFKNRIKAEEAAKLELLTNLDPKAEALLPEEEQKTRKQEFKDNMARISANIKALKEELKLIRLNKRMSSFFQFEAHKGFNRRQARKFRKIRHTLQSK